MDARLKLQILAVARSVAMTAAGLTLAVIPLALWASPTLSVFYAVLTTCAVACGVVLVLSQIGPDEPARGQRRDERVRLSPWLVRHLQNQRELGRKDLPELRRFVQDKVMRRGGEKKQQRSDRKDLK